VTDSHPLLEMVDLQKHFPITRSLADQLSRRPAKVIHAVDGVSLTVGPGETLGLIGESGSGKTTLGWMLARLHEPTSGSIVFDGVDVTHLRSTSLRTWRRNVQIVFQDPVGSLDPRLRVWQIVGEPIRAQNMADRWLAVNGPRLARRAHRLALRQERERLTREFRAAMNPKAADRARLRREYRAQADAREKLPPEEQRRLENDYQAALQRADQLAAPLAPERDRLQTEYRAAMKRGIGPAPVVPKRPKPPVLHREAVRKKVQEVLPTVGLPVDCLDQYPHEFSGGGRQRLSLARALSVSPRLIVLDEPTSALDVAVQAQILNRLVELQRSRGLAYVLITHNVAAVRFVADRVAVMYLGRIVEHGPVRELLERPVHPYTKALLAAVPVPDPSRRHTRYRIGGDIPSLVDLPPGCRFAPRCPFVIDRCKVEDPPLLPMAGTDRLVACHRADEVADIRPESLLASDTPSPGEAPAVPPTSAA
jgi:oligopeptide/dipeptide ABC transporter ATP-binding protein